MPLPMIVVQGAGFLASLALWEGIASIFEHMSNEPGNDPDAVNAALMNASQSASREALWESNKDARIQEGLSKQFSGISPTSGLGELAMLQSGVLDRTDPDKYPVLNHVSQKLNMRPDDFVKRTSPTRMGDLTGIQQGVPTPMREIPNGR